jgi:uncharacterized Fe-S center protein
MYDKLNQLINQAGIEELDVKDKLVALKIHFGEPATWLICGRIMRRWL